MTARRSGNFAVLVLIAPALGCASYYGEERQGLGTSWGETRAADDGWAERVAEQHAQVDGMLDRGAGAEARALPRTIVEREPAQHPQRRPILQDTHFRLARLALASGEPATAVREADAGLALADGADLFSANLLVVRGAAREALGQASGAANDYERALAINETLLKGALPAP